MKIFWVLVLSLVSACAPYMHQEVKTFFAPLPAFLRNLPAGEDNFSKGFRDGCYNFLGHNGFGLHRIYDRSPTPELVTEKLYRQGYEQGDRYCGTYVNNQIIL